MAFDTSSVHFFISSSLHLFLSSSSFLSLSIDSSVDSEEGDQHDEVLGVCVCHRLGCAVPDSGSGMSRSFVIGASVFLVTRAKNNTRKIPTTFLQVAKTFIAFGSVGLGRKFFFLQ